MTILLLGMLPVQVKLSYESGCTGEIQRQMNRDALEAEFDLTLAPL